MDNEILENMARSNIVKSAKNQNTESLMNNYLSRLIKKVHSGIFTSSDKIQALTDQEVKSLVRSKTGGFIANNKKLVYGAVASAMGVASINTQNTAKGITEMTKGLYQTYDAKIALLSNPSYLDNIQAYASSSNYASLSLFAVATMGFIALGHITTKFKDRNLTEEDISQSLKILDEGNKIGKEFDKILMEHKENAFFSLIIANIQKGIDSIANGFKNSMDIAILCVHKFKNSFISQGLMVVFGEEKCRNFENRTRNEIIMMENNVQSKILGRENDKSGHNFHRVVLDKIKNNMKNIGDDCSSNGKLDKKVKSIYEAIVKKVYNESLVINTREIIKINIENIIRLTGSSDKKDIKELEDNIAILDKISMLKLNTSNKDLNNYTLLSDVASDFLTKYQNSESFKEFENKTSAEIFNNLSIENINKLINNVDENNQKINTKDDVLKSVVIALEDDKPFKFFSRIHSSIDIKVNKHNADEDKKDNDAIASGQGALDFLKSKLEENTPSPSQIRNIRI
jgi:hypothetical protein